MAVYDYANGWLRITPGNNAADAIIWGHGARSTARWTGKDITRPFNATLKFYCPPNKILTNIEPQDIYQRVVYYSAKYKKVHDYLVSCLGLEPNSLQEAANSVGCDLYSPNNGRHDLTLSNLFSHLIQSGFRYGVIHCLFCRIGVLDRQRVRSGEASRDAFKYRARKR